MKSHFSYHAFVRVKGRILMPHEQLAGILDDANSYINIGDEKKTNRVHKLFYSETDNMCFVAVQDYKTGTVITILPIDYHENIAWSVPIEFQLEAKRLILKDEFIPIKRAVTDLNKPISKARVFKISGSLVNEFGERVSTVTLGSWPCEPYAQSIDALVKDKHFVNGLKHMINEAVISTEGINHFVQTIGIKLGKKGESVFYEKSELIPVGA